MTVFIPVDRPYIAVAGPGVVHAAAVETVVVTSGDGRRKLEDAARWSVACGTPVATRLAVVAGIAGGEPFVSPWPAFPAVLHAYGPACPSCLKATDAGTFRGFGSGEFPVEVET